MTRPFGILLVEDSESDILLVNKAIEKLGMDCQLHVVRDGEDFVEFFRNGNGENGSKKNNIDLILLDLNMLRMNGFEVLEHRNSDPDLKDIPVVILTSSLNDKDIEKAYELGANGYLAKPIEIDVFMETVAKAAVYWHNLFKRA
ncbi:MAG: response regulator [Candidatus Omnitrophica bacterium]|nr:response regulator [Candidatus Omnitrophota bacterium]MBU4332940.1 response regulator [Candidatus Omnitrophota bacterium]